MLPSAATPLPATVPAAEVVSLPPAPARPHGRRAISPLGSLAELLLRLDTTPAGLTTPQAEQRARLAAERTGGRTPRAAAVLATVRGVVNPLVAILAIAGVASAFLGEPVQAALIGAMIALSAAIDLWQTTRSTRAVQRLQAQITPTASVLRDGAWRELPRDALVVGDVIRLAAGDMLPADARLLTATDLHIQQAALTGEAFPVEKQVAARDRLASDGPDCPALAYLGTSVVSGSATAVVFATGRDTAFGDVVAALAARPPETELERGVRDFGLMIVRTVGFLVLFVLVINLALGRDAMESLLFSVALAVGLTPELLPVITTVTLAQGAVRMARDQVIVKHLPAIQNLGSIDILCSDKTGTLTTGTMALEAALDPFGAPSPRTLELARRNSRFETGIASPLDAAILAGAPAADDGWRKTDEIPFDFERRRMSIAVARAGAYQLVCKGAPESVLAVCTAYEHAGAAPPLDAAARARCEQVF
ncbi:MAG TPA: HAD-IC family P-type ATPase, partial [Kofleriaceae bacterium]|nr:HAD-IC family P-type ATPase [Kofleriaceae bacterium]